MNVGLPAKLHQDLKQFLLDSNYCQSDKLKNLFIIAPLNLWADDLPAIKGEADYAEEVIRLLASKQTNKGERALILLCQAIVDQIPPEDAHHQQGLNVLKALQALNWTQVKPYLEPAYHSYLNHLFEQANEIWLGDIDPTLMQGDKEARLQLTSIYTGLQTTAHKQVVFEGLGREQKPEIRTAVDLLNKHPHLVLLGDPGSGKSTFVKFVAMCMAGEWLGKSENLALLTQPLPEHDEPQPWSHGTLLPIRVVLRDFVTQGLPTNLEQKGTIRHLWQYIQRQCTQNGQPTFTKTLHEHWRRDGGLLLLDGLDEVPNANQRRVQLKQVIEGFKAAYPRVRILVTSRIYAYQKLDWKLKNFAEATLAPFDMAQIRQYVQSWYAYVAPQKEWSSQEAHAQAEHLYHQLEANQSLRDLAAQPLLLALISTLHTWRGRLPDDRHKLYKDAVDLLLYRWQKPMRGTDSEYRKGLIDWLQIEQTRVMALLARLAFEVQSGGELERTADIPEDKLVYGLYGLQKQEQRFPIHDIVDYLRDRAGILVAHGEKVYSFPHRTFQEYLAAVHLYEADNFPDGLANLAIEEPNRWREVLLLCAAMGNRTIVWLVVRALLDAAEEIDSQWGVHLAGQVLAETGAYQSTHKRDKRLLADIQEDLLTLIQSSDLPVTERVLTGDNLAVLGDPRFHDKTSFYLPKDPLLGFVEIPVGNFQMGEKPPFDVELDRFYMAKYSVTVAQFRVFVEQTSYPLVDGDSILEEATRPVRWITWGEAMAYAQWLTETLRDSPHTPEPLRTLLTQGWQVTLPTEKQWEKAARGTDGCVYPWGNTFKEENANYEDTKLGHPSPVGCFPAGASPYGLLDMSGNVWEWTRTIYASDAQKAQDTMDSEQREDIVVRGGAYYYESEYLRCAYRNLGNHHHFHGSYFGFRVCLSSISR